MMIFLIVDATRGQCYFIALYEGASNIILGNGFCFVILRIDLVVLCILSKHYITELSL